MKSLSRKIFIFLLLAALIAGCSGQPAATAISPTAEPAAAEESEATAVSPAADETAQEEEDSQSADGSPEYF